MRYNIFYWSALLVLLFNTACKKPSDEKIFGQEEYTTNESIFIWENRSSHTITMSVGGSKDCTFVPGEKLVHTEYRALWETCNLQDLLRTTPPIFVFDEGTYGCFIQPDQSPINYYDESLYQYSEKKTGDDDQITIPCWTYVFTDADYDAAVARGEFDPAHFHYVSWCNEGSQDLFLSMGGRGNYDFDRVPIPVGDSYTQRYLRPSKKSSTPVDFLGFHFIIEYADGVTLKTGTGDSVDSYNLKNDQIYTQTQTQEGATLWVYTFSDSFYNEAVRRAERKIQ